jgi:hypothetical protein
LFSCKTQKVITKNEEPVVVSVESTVKEKEQSFNLPQVLPQAIVYKTVKAYNHLIPVTMDAERTKIVSYPAPSDVFYKGKLALPTVLQDGYLLDNRGIDENTVFLNYTYDEYSRLQEAPPMSEMMNKIRDKHPLAEIIFCGDRTKYKDEVKELNELIKNGFPNCRRVVLMSTSIQLSM